MSWPLRFTVFIATSLPRYLKHTHVYVRRTTWAIFILRAFNEIHYFVVTVWHTDKRATIKDTPFCCKRFWSAYGDLSTNYTVLFFRFQRRPAPLTISEVSQFCWERCNLSKVLHRIDRQIFIDVEENSRTFGFNVKQQVWSPLKMEAKQSSETSVTVYQSTRRKFPRNLNFLSTAARTSNLAIAYFGKFTQSNMRSKWLKVKRFYSTVKKKCCDIFVHNVRYVPETLQQLFPCEYHWK
jgi:hypothetical protein